MDNVADFKRPEGFSTGVLLNTNNEALRTYKKAKKRFASVVTLEKTVDELRNEIEELKRLVYDRINNTD